MAIALLVLPGCAEPSVEPAYKVVFGNTHSHCNYSGDIAKSRAKRGLGLDPENTVENHFRIAKESGYDFYFMTDHSQYPEYTPEAWKDIEAKAAAVTDATFVAMRGYEHSENDGPDGKGHMNVYNSNCYLNALADSVSIEFFHNWLARQENDDVIVCFNHPPVKAYNEFHCYNESARSHFKMMELINGKNARFYPTFLKALSAGYKVSPVAGCDNHSWQGIAKWPARTGLLVTELTPEGVLDAMASRRTYATYDTDLSICYYVNGMVMGSEIPESDEYRFDIRINDPDVEDDGQKITRVEIVSENGEVVESSSFDSHEVDWDVVVSGGKGYYFLLVYNVEKADSPAAYVAPVWIKK